jgi:amino acid transporter
MARSSILWLLFESWLWIIICGCILVLLGPFVFLFVFFGLPEGLPRLIAGIFMIIGSGIAGGVKEWYLHKSKEEEKEKWYAGEEESSRPL